MEMQVSLMFTAMVLLQSAMCSGVIHFSQSVYNVTVNETALPEHPRPPLGFVNISCVSMSPNITYSIKYSSNVLPFEVDPHTGQLNATADIDYDSQDDDFEFYSFNVSCNDGIHNATALVQVYVNPINEFQPEIDNNSIVLSIDETTANGTLLLSTVPGGLKMITVEDRDRGPHGTIIFTMLFPLDDHFTFDPVEANLTLVRAIDFEMESNITRYLYHELALQIRVCDATTPADACPLISFPLFVLPSDDNEPMFLMDIYTATLNETTPLSSIVLTLECSDADIHYGGISTIDLVDPSAVVEKTFSLGKLSNNGSIQLILAQNLDYDRLNQSYWFQVSCNDILHSTRANVSVQVLPENDEVPIFTATHYCFTINRAALSGTIIGQVTAIDIDVDSGLPVGYALHHSTNSALSIDSATGEIVVNNSLQYLPPEVTLTVSATDGEFDAYTHVTVNIFPGNFPPIFYETNITLSIYENATWPAVIYTLVACYVDSPAITYNISSDYPTPFTINQTTAQLILVTSLDRETTPTYTITLIATEVHLDGSYGNSVSTNLTIHVLDSNDNAPIFRNPFEESLTLPDTTPRGYIFHSVQCTDKDEGTNGEIVYDILPQHYLFAVDRNGSVLVNKSLDLPDFVLSESHNISIQCIDMAIPSLNSNKTIIITINKTDTQPPQVNQSNSSVMLLENAPIGTHITTLLIYDVDSLALSLAIVNQTVPGTFSLSPSSPYNHPNYPDLTLNGTVDREDIAIHYVELLATSVPSTTPVQNTTFTVPVMILDVNDNAPQCSRGRVTITAGSYNQSNIFSLSCSDPDEGVNQQLIYELQNVVPLLNDSQFIVDQLSGEVGLEGREISEGTYLITVVVSDLGTPPMNTTVVVEVMVVSDLGIPPMNTTVLVEVMDKGIPLLVIIVLAVFTLLMSVSVITMCSICCCHLCGARITRKKNYPLSTSAPIENRLGGVTIISQPAFSDTTSVLSHSLVLATEDTTDGPEEMSTDEVTVIFNSPEISGSSSKRLSDFLDEQWPLSYPHCTASLSSSKEDLALQLEQEASVTTFKGVHWQTTPTHSNHPLDPISSSSETTDP